VTRSKLGRQYLTRAKVQALLNLASRGEDWIEAQLSDMLAHGELEPADLPDWEREEHDTLVQELTLAKQARQILASRVKGVQP